MVFGSVIFIFRFLPIFFILYYISPAKIKNFTLLLGSIFFCVFSVLKPPYSMVPIAIVVISYLAGILLEKARKTPLRSVLLVLSLLFIIAPLFYFKYSPFIIENINTVFDASFEISTEFILPLGISIYTLTAAAYIIDIAAGKIKAERNFIDFSSYLLMFPLLAFGPVVTYSDIKAQIKDTKNRVTIKKINTGIQDFVLGLAKKVLLADTIGAVWREVVSLYNNGQPVLGKGASSALLCFGIVALALQIYFELSGYSSMAAGLAKLLGFNIADNFNQPFAAKSLVDFTNRWNISLTSWFKKYVYEPINRKDKIILKILAIVISSFMAFMWYGANNTLALLAVIFAVLLILETTLLSKLLKKGRVWQHIYVLLLLFVATIFLASSFENVGLSVIVSGIFGGQGDVGVGYYFRNYIFVFIAGVIFATPLPSFLYRKTEKIQFIRIIVTMLLFIACLVYIIYGAYTGNALISQ